MEGVGGERLYQTVTRYGLYLMSQMNKLKERKKKKI